ncbi:MAG: acyltransferase [Planctomycetota bacterium]
MGKTRSVYFPNLNGLRFIAALVVMIHHTEQGKLSLGLPSVFLTSPFIGVIGKLGVVLFFVLSGFLITYLLLEEESQTGISVRHFYVRRILRIWPLYYLIILLALFVLPYVSFFTFPGYGIDVVHENLWFKTVLYVTLFANLILPTVGLVPYASQTWSVGTEEQFYLLWPLLTKYVRNKVRLMLSVIALYLAARVLLSPRIVVIGTGPWQSWLTGFLGAFNIDCMAIGGLAAVILHKRHKPLAWMLNLPVFYVTLTVAVILIAGGVTFHPLHYEFYAVLFALLILNFAANDRIGWSLEFEPFHYLGKISYGLYMFHPIAISVALRLLSRLGWTHDIAIYPACTLATIGLAAVSYRFFESPFLRMKDRFAEVVSGESARSAVVVVASRPPVLPDEPVESPETIPRQ